MAKVQAGSGKAKKAAAAPPKKEAAKLPAKKGEDLFAGKEEAKGKNLPSVPKKESTALSLDDFDHGGAGLENVSAKDILVPRITLLQGLSPQITKGKPEYNEDAEVGDFCDTGTGELFRGELNFVPCFFARILLEWGAQRGKGLIANHGTDFTPLDDAEEEIDANGSRRMVNSKGNILVETATWYVLNLDAGRRKSFIPLSSTMLKPSRGLMTMITGERLRRADGTEFVPPIYYRAWKAIPVTQQNDKGIWANWSWKPGPNIVELDPTKTLLKEAIAFYNQAKDGLLRGDLGSAEEATAATAGGSDGTM